MLSRPADQPPLLPLGFHPRTMDEVEQLCVQAFPRSVSRPAIMSGLRIFLTKLIDSGISGELWLDGSFLTTKIDPKDVDVVLRMRAADVDNGSPTIRETVQWVAQNQKEALFCDSYLLTEYPTNNSLYEEGHWWYSYWVAQWGFSREGDPKGIVVVQVGEV